MEKYLHYYTQHSQYVEPTNKPAVSYCDQEDEVHYIPRATTFTFILDGYLEYQAEEGMTWGEWVNSSYNTNGFHIGTFGTTNNAVLMPPTNQAVADTVSFQLVTVNDIIDSNAYDTILPAD